MLPVGCCGGECGLLGVAGSHWTGVTGSPSISTTTVRSGSRSIRCNPSASEHKIRSADFHTSSSRHVGRFYVYFATLPDVDANIGGGGSFGGLGPGIRFKQSDSKLYASVSTTLGASGVAVTTGQWYLIDYDFQLNAGGTHVSNVQVDGVACGQASASTAAGGGNQDEFGVFSATVTADAFFDDFLFSSTAADYPLGAGKVDHFVPTADGTHNVAGANDFERSGTGTDITNATTTAFQLVDDVPLKAIAAPSDYINLIAPPNATDYVEVVYGPAPGISTPSSAPRSVEVIVGYSAGATGTCNIRLALNDNGTTDDVFNGNPATANTNVRYSRKHYATPPTGGAWTVTSGAGDFNNLRIRCLTNDAAPDPFFTGTMIEAEFAADTGQDITASAPTVTVSAPSATLVPGAVSVPATAPTVTVSAPAASLVKVVPATAPSITVSAPAAQQVSRTIPATAPSVNVSAPAATVVPGVATIIATAPSITVSAPAAQVNRTVPATAPTVTVSAPAAQVNRVVAATAPTVTVSAPAAQVNRTIPATAPTVTVSAPDASISAGGGGQNITATAPTVTVSAPAAQQVSRTIPATSSLITLSAPAATVVPGLATISATALTVTVSTPAAQVNRTIPATAPTVTISAPAAQVNRVVAATAPSITVSAPAAQQVARTIPAGAPSVAVLAPAAGLSAGGVLPASAPEIVVSAPAAAILAGAVSLPASAPSIAVSAPSAALQAQISLLAGAPSIAVSAPAAALLPGVAILPASAPTVSVIAPAPSLQLSGTLQASASTVVVSAPAAVLAPGQAIITTTAPTITVSAPEASLIASGGPQTIVATAASIAISAPSATIFGVVVIPASAPSIAVSAPAAIVYALTPLPATAPIIMVSASAATVIGGPTTVPALASIVVVSVPVGTVFLGIVPSTTDVANFRMSTGSAKNLKFTSGTHNASMASHDRSLQFSS